jgi:ankyrin repeat protein
MKSLKQIRLNRSTVSFCKMGVGGILVAFIMSGCNPHPPSLCGASDSGDYNLVKKLLSEGADPNSRSPGQAGTPALVSAANNGYARIVSLLLTHGADVNAADKRSGWNALMRAACTDRLSNSLTRLEILRLLVQHGADVNSRDRDGNTPLHYACIATGQDTEVLRLLISYGAEINAKNKRGETLLYWATTGGIDGVDWDFIKLMIRLGADD